MLRCLLPLATIDMRMLQYYYTTTSSPSPSPSLLTHLSDEKEATRTVHPGALHAADPPFGPIRARTSHNPSGLIRYRKPWLSLFFLTYHNITRVTQLHVMYFFESRTVGLARCAGRCVITYVQRRCQGRTCRLAMLDVSPGKWHSSMLIKDNGNFLHRSTYYDHSSIT